MRVCLPQPGLLQRPAMAVAASRLLRALLVAAVLSATAPSVHADSAARLREIGTLAEQDPQQARTILEHEALALIAGAPYAQRIATLRLLGRVQVDSGKLRAADQTNEQIAELAAAEADSANLALAILARVNRQLDDNDPAAALTALDTLAKRYGDNVDPEFRAGLEMRYGLAWRALGQDNRALQHFQRTLDIVRRNPGLWSPRELDVLLAMARIYVTTGDAEQALAILRELRAGRFAVPARSAAALNLLEGRALIVQNDPGAALSAFERALELARANGLAGIEAKVLAGVANANLKLQRFGQAEAAARAALAAARTSADGVSLQMAQAKLGLALFGQGRESEGLDQVDAVLAQLRQSGTKSVLDRLLAEKSLALERAGRYREALVAAREREAISKTLAQADRDKAIWALQEQFKVRERTAQSDSLRQQNAVKDVQLHNHGLRQLSMTLGAALALVLAGVAFMLTRRSMRSSARLSQLNDELAYLSARDPLTGLFNRRSFQDRMRSRTGEAAARPDAADCFTLLDIDHFKRINDEHGHAAGDMVLVEVGRRLRQATRDSDMVLRWGGEEFLVYSQGVAADQRGLLVRRMLDAIAATPIVLSDGTALRISATAGAVSLPFAQEAGETEAQLEWEQAIALADRALYKGKQAGRNRGYMLAGLRRSGGGALDGLKLDLVLPAGPGMPGLPGLPA